MLPTPPPPADELPFTAVEARRLGRVRRYFAEHPVAMDWLVIAWFAVPSAITAAVEPRGTAPMVCVVLAAAALYWRRRRALTTLAVLTALGCAYILLTGDTGGFELPYAFGMYAVATQHRPRTAWVALVVVTGASTLALLNTRVTSPELEMVDLSREGYAAGAAAGVLIFALAGLAVGNSVRNRREHTQRLVDRANQLALERDQRELLAAAAERTRIAREMHDVVAHSLSVMIALADGAGASLAKAPERSAEALRELSSTGRNALADMRRILGVLRDGPVDGDAGGAPMTPQPGAPALGDLIARFRAAGLPVRLTQTGPPLPDDAGLQLTVYRIVQEGLTNVLRHAPGATYIAVTITCTDEEVTVSVRNDLGVPGAAPQPGGGQGLIGMRERAAVFGGTVEAGHDAGGWRLRAVLRFTGEKEG